MLLGARDDRLEGGVARRVGAWVRVRVRGRGRDEKARTLTLALALAPTPSPTLTKGSLRVSVAVIGGTVEPPTHTLEEEAEAREDEARADMTRARDVQAAARRREEEKAAEVPRRARRSASINTVTLARNDA